ncbi:hypothetical protein VP01_335g9 [Puccinia sorghi]|uniref:Uncharacterized protein n=1 Tax=Puccinia sorghi TaxID=27349 RepID=A0A0L6UYU7_9BASI|nr:hypothetical protein VP01_335g9 [Puccinia sorghi]
MALSVRENRKTDGFWRNTRLHKAHLSNWRSHIAVMLATHAQWSRFIVISSHFCLDKICLILSINNLSLPHWDSIRKSSRMLHELLILDINKESIFQKHCSAISIKDIQAHVCISFLCNGFNPYVNHHLHFYTEDPFGKYIHSFYQIQKWRELLDPDNRTQMKVVIPIYFFVFENEMYANTDTLYLSTFLCTQNIIFFIEVLADLGILETEVHRDGNHRRQLPNLWRIKASGRLIRHISINLYSDDTSGYNSKQCNKHNSFYFTLLGLSPRHTNQEYNIHFVTNSNTATPLELAELVVDEMNEIGSRGFMAYDPILKSEVLVMSLVLFFLADSPMDAEVTSTPYPGASNNPCRVCQLGVMKREDKAGLKYVLKLDLVCESLLHCSFTILDCVQDFFGIKKVANRVWDQTKSNTKELWTISQAGKQTDFDSKEKIYAVKDSLNADLMESSKDNSAENACIEEIIAKDPLCMYNPFTQLNAVDGSHETPVEILHVFLLGAVKYLLKDFMKNSKHNHAKIEVHLADFDTDSLNIPQIQANVLQVSPFVLFYFMTEKERELWFELCYLGSLLFQTNIHDLEDYLRELVSYFKQIFMTWKIICGSSKCTLIYSYFMSSKCQPNGQTSQSSTFLFTCCLQFAALVESLFATEKFEIYNSILHTSSIHSNWIAPSRDIAIRFSNYHFMRLLLSGAFYMIIIDINIFSHLQKSQKYFTLIHLLRSPWVKTHKPFNISRELSKRVNGAYLQQLKAFQINHNEVVSKKSYIMVRLNFQATLPLSTEETLTCVNVQPDCYNGNCKVTKTSWPMRPQQENKAPTKTIAHSPTNQYLLNVCSHHSLLLHRLVSHINFAPVYPQQAQQIIQQ